MQLPAELAIGTLRTIRELTAEVGGHMVRLSATLRASTAKSGVDLVTAADRYSEEALSSRLALLFPEHRIAGEEGTRLGPPDSPWIWHIDPLDGTANYSRAIPHWAISIGLAYQDQPVLGIVHGPACGVTVLGAVGLGAWEHDTPLPRATAPGETRTWIIATDWPWDLDERTRTNLLLARLAPCIRQYKTFGSAALDFAAVVRGQADAYAISKIFPWDQAGGAAIAAALGYEMRCWDGQPWDLSHGDIALSRPGMWEVLGPALARP